MILTLLGVFIDKEEKNVMHAGMHTGIPKGEGHVKVEGGHGWCFCPCAKEHQNPNSHRKPGAKQGMVLLSGF